MHNLLLVDDDPDVLASLRRSFRKGYTAFTASNGQEAIKILNEQQIDLIICDQRMPDITGNQVLSHALDKQPDAVRILLTGYADIEALMSCVNDASIYKYLTKPWEPKDLELTVIRALESYDYKRKLAESNRLLEVAYRDAIKMLCVAAEGKDEDTGNHLYRVQEYTEALAISIGLDEQTAKRMGVMSMLHDIGKMVIPDHILKKPGILTNDEMDVMKTHALAGVKILGDNPFYELAREIAGGHHEKYDGTGYPNQIKGDAIPLSARIVKVADVFDALTTARPYKEAWPMSAAITFMETESEIHYDPNVITHMRKLYDDGTLLTIKSKHL